MLWKWIDYRNNRATLGLNRIFSMNAENLNKWDDGEKIKSVSRY
jgi:hypothetical protein